MWLGPKPARQPRLTCAICVLLQIVGKRFVSIFCGRKLNTQKKTQGLSIEASDSIPVKTMAAVSTSTVANPSEEKPKEVICAV